MNSRKILGVASGISLLASATAYAEEPGINIRLGLIQTDLTAEASNSQGDSYENSTDFLALELNGTLTFDQYYVNGEYKTATLKDDDLEDLHSFALLGGYRITDQSSVFIGYKKQDWEEALESSGFFAGYSHLFPFENYGTALVLSGALGLLEAELDGVSGVESDPTLGYNLKASYLYPVNDEISVSGDLTLYSYQYDFEGPGGTAEIEERSLGFGVTVSYALQ